MSKQDDYFRRYQRLHDGSEGFRVNGVATTGRPNLFTGSNFMKYLEPRFGEHIRDIDSARVLDYGCGKAMHVFEGLGAGDVMHQKYGRKIQTFYCYDPGYKVFSHPPSGKFNVVICADVMEHVISPDQTLFEITKYLEPRAAVFFSISGKPAMKEFLDGENLHISVHPFEYWVEKLKDYFYDASLIYLRYDDENGEQIWEHRE